MKGSAARPCHTIFYFERMEGDINVRSEKLNNN